VMKIFDIVIHRGGAADRRRRDGALGLAGGLRSWARSCSPLRSSRSAAAERRLMFSSLLRADGRRPLALGRFLVRARDGAHARRRARLARHRDEALGGLCVGLAALASSGSLPFGSSGRKRAARSIVTDHWLYRALRKRPNRYQNPFEWREMCGATSSLRGNCLQPDLRQQRRRDRGPGAGAPGPDPARDPRQRDYRFRISNRAPAREEIVPAARSGTCADCRTTASWA
jgi:hypothetical protein